MKEIRGDSKNIRALLGGTKFSVDYYQREYRWENKHIAELVDDLSEKFLEGYEPRDDRSKVEQYVHYFLGSIIISEKDGRKYIIDGQQRLTSLTLLLIYLHRSLSGAVAWHLAAAFMVHESEIHQHCRMRFPRARTTQLLPTPSGQQRQRGPTSRLVFGTDTFVVRHRKIVSQTFGGVTDPR